MKRALFFFLCLFAAVEGTYNNFEDNPYISSEAREEMRPYLLPEDHPMRDKLDNLFRKNITKNEKTFLQSGFVLRHKKQPRSYILVAGHEELPGYLIKIHMDNEKREKHDKPSCHWFVLRCEGAKKIAKVIHENEIKNFTVAKKWIYPIPYDESLPEKALAKKNHVLLLVEDMEVLSPEESRKAWKKKITSEHLNDLYQIMTLAGGRNYRPANLPYTKNKTFAFIDTEYPRNPPEYHEIPAALSSKMKVEWKEILKKNRIIEG